MPNVGEHIRIGAGSETPMERAGLARIVSKAAGRLMMVAERLAGGLAPMIVYRQRQSATLLRQRCPGLWAMTIALFLLSLNRSGILSLIRRH